MSVLAALAAAAGCGAAGLLVPRLVRAVPEPADPGDPPKPRYADVGATPGLWWRTALASAVAGGGAGAVLGWHWWLLVLVPVVPVCVALTVIDWHTRLLPSRLVLPATGYLVVAGLAGWAITGDHADLLRAALGLMIARPVYWLLWFLHSAGMGFGDVRLAALLGFALGHVGWAEFVVGMYAGFLVFGLPGLLLAVLRRDRALLKVAYPFGPFMLLGGWLGLLTGPWFLARLVGG